VQSSYLRAFAEGFAEAWREAWPDIVAGSKRGARDALVGFWTPMRPRLWRFVYRELRQTGLWAAVTALLFRGYSLIINGRLDPQGRVLPRTDA
jgi:hypothetical protein